jgi:hypothetical protein
MTLDSSGNVGIGTSSPAGKLAIASTGNTGSSLEAYSATDGIIPDFQLLKSGSGTIGTLSTTANGEALGQIRFTGIDTANNKRDGAKISVYQDSTATSGTVPAGIRFDTNGTERMRIDSSGNVGIGTSSPTGPLSVQSNTNATDQMTFLNLISWKMTIQQFLQDFNQGQPTSVFKLNKPFLLFLALMAQNVCASTAAVTCW